jgi:hypothetical protein
VTRTKHKHTHTHTQTHTHKRAHTHLATHTPTATPHGQPYVCTRLYHIYPANLWQMHAHTRHTHTYTQAHTYIHTYAHAQHKHTTCMTHRSHTFHLHLQSVKAWTQMYDWVRLHDDIDASCAHMAMCVCHVYVCALCVCACVCLRPRESIPSPQKGPHIVQQRSFSPAGLSSSSSRLHLCPAMLCCHEDGKGTISACHVLAFLQRFHPLMSPLRAGETCPHVQHSSLVLCWAIMALMARYWGG